MSDAPSRKEVLAYWHPHVRRLSEWLVDACACGEADRWSQHEHRRPHAHVPVLAGIYWLAMVRAGSAGRGCLQDYSAKHALHLAVRVEKDD
jgi:hypothetical protein